MSRVKQGSSGPDFERGLKRLRHKTQLEKRQIRAFKKLRGNYPSPRAHQEWEAYHRLRTWWSRPQIKCFVSMYGTNNMNRKWPGILDTPGRPSVTEFLHDVGLLAEGEYARTLPTKEMFELLSGKEAARGVAFMQGPKKCRSDALGRLIDHALAELPPRAAAKEVMRKIEEIDRGKIIDRIDPDDLTIEWRGRDGKERTTTFKAFENRLSAHRKKIR